MILLYTVWKNQQAYLKWIGEENKPNERIAHAMSDDTVVEWCFNDGKIYVTEYEADGKGTYSQIDEYVDSTIITANPTLSDMYSWLLKQVND